MVFADKDGKVIATLPKDTARLLTDEPEKAAQRLEIWRKVQAGELGQEELVAALKDAGLAQSSTQSVGGFRGAHLEQVFDPKASQALLDLGEAVRQGEDPMVAGTLAATALFGDWLGAEETKRLLLSFVPIVGQAIAAEDFVKALDKGDFGSAALMAITSLVSPAIGKGVVRVSQAAKTLLTREGKAAANAAEDAAGMVGEAVPGAGAGGGRAVANNADHADEVPATAGRGQHSATPKKTPDDENLIRQASQVEAGLNASVSDILGSEANQLTSREMKTAGLAYNAARGLAVEEKLLAEAEKEAVTRGNVVIRQMTIFDTGGKVLMRADGVEVDPSFLEAMKKVGIEDHRLVALIEAKAGQSQLSKGQATAKSLRPDIFKETRGVFNVADPTVVLELLANDARMLALPPKARNTIAFYLADLAKNRKLSILGVSASLEILFDQLSVGSSSS